LASSRKRRNAGGTHWATKERNGDDEAVLKAASIKREHRTVPAAGKEIRKKGLKRKNLLARQYRLLKGPEITNGERYREKGAQEEKRKGVTKGRGKRSGFENGGSLLAMKEFILRTQTNESRHHDATLGRRSQSGLKPNTGEGKAIKC